MTAPANDQRQINEMVRSLSAKLPNQTDLSKAMAWGTITASGSAIQSSYNIKSVTNNGTGQLKVTLSTPFKDTSYSIVAQANSRVAVVVGGGNTTTSTFLIYSYEIGNSNASSADIYFACFGELENE